VQQIVQSDAMRRAIHDVVTSPEVRQAVTEETKGLFADLVADLQTRAARLDDRVETTVRKGHASEAGPFAGVVTRGLAFGFDLLAIVVVSALFTGILALVSYLLGGIGSKSLVGGVLSGEFLLVAATYLVVFWTVAGRTPGMQLMALRLRDRAGTVPSLGRSLVRVIMTWISIALLFLGYVPILFDARRRGLPDLVAGTEVVYDDGR
jgi:uncharacterized RDD family membrane protein YckC